MDSKPGKIPEESVDHIEVMHPITFEKQYTPEEHVIDVRNEGEWAGGVIDGTVDSVESSDQGIWNSGQEPEVLCSLRWRVQEYDGLFHFNEKRVQKWVNITGGINLMKETNYNLVVPPAVHA